MLFPDFILIKVLYIVVDTGFVEGQSATITPTSRYDQYVQFGEVAGQ